MQKGKNKYHFRAVFLLLTIFCLTPLLAQQRGKATYYSKRATGARAASGVRIHHDSLICAHRTYPFGTLLKVTNPQNNKSVIVEVVDRGPFARGRIIDLSYAAAHEIGIISAGVASVEVSVYKHSTKIPFKPEDDGISLPKVDLEVAEIGFSFIDDWKEKKDEEASVNPKTALANNSKPSVGTKPATGAKPSVATKPSVTSKSSVVSAKPSPTGSKSVASVHPVNRAANAQQHRQAATKVHQEKKTEEDGNIFSNVFDKIKNYFED